MPTEKAEFRPEQGDDDESSLLICHICQFKDKYGNVADVDVNYLNQIKLTYCRLLDALCPMP